MFDVMARDRRKATPRMKAPVAVLRVGSPEISPLVAVLGAYAATRGLISGEPTLSTATGAFILGVAFLLSLAITSNMKHKDQTRKAWEDYQRAWQEYYARIYAGYGRQR